MSLSSPWDGVSIKNEWFSEQVSGVNRGPNIPGEPGDGKPSSRPERLSCRVEEGSVGAAESFENIAS